MIDKWPGNPFPQGLDGDLLWDRVFRRSLRYALTQDGLGLTWWQRGIIDIWTACFHTAGVSVTLIKRCPWLTDRCTRTFSFKARASQSVQINARKIFWKYIRVTVEKNNDVTDSYAEQAVKETVPSDNVPAREFEKRLYFLTGLYVKYAVVAVYCSRTLLKFRLTFLSFFFFLILVLWKHVSSSMPPLFRHFYLLSPSHHWEVGLWVVLAYLSFLYRIFTAPSGKNQWKEPEEIILGLFF